MRTPFFALIVLVGLFSFTGCKKDDGPKPPSVAELTDMLQNGEPEKQLLAIGWVRQLGPKAKATKPALLAALKNTSAAVRQNAAIALGTIGPDAAAEAVPALTALLSDPDPSVQMAAITSLGEFGPAASSAIPAIEAVSKTSDGCKAPSVNALKKIRS